MINLVLFVLTVVIYFGIWFLIQEPAGLKQALKRVGLLALLCLPFNINGHVVTVMGNAVSEKNVLSICSLYQKAGKDAVAALAGYQEAGENASAVLAGYQEAGENAGAVLAGYQEAGENAFASLASGYQKAGKDASAILAGYQKAGKIAFALLASGYQKAGNKERLFGLFSKLTAD